MPPMKNKVCEVDISKNQQFTTSDLVQVMHLNWKKEGC